MVTISVSIISAHTGNVILARQFVPISRQRLESYLASFPKLIPYDHSNQQHTIIETEQIRYLYQPIESVYLLLLTNKASNIMEDIDTLRLLAKLIPEYTTSYGTSTSNAGTVPTAVALSEQAIQEHVYELIFAFDEVITVNGYKESLTLTQIKAFTEMDSHEEKLQKIILESKMNEAKNEMNRKAESIERQRAEAKREAALVSNSLAAPVSRHGRYDSMSSGGSGTFSSSPSIPSSASFSNDDEEERRKAASKSPINASSSSSSSSSAKPKGMQLSKAKQGDDFLSQLSKEEVLAPVIRPVSNLGNATASSPAPTVASEPVIPSVAVQITSRERVLCELERDGAVKRVQITGEMKCAVFDPDEARIIIHTASTHASSTPLEANGYKIQLHPKIDKKLWASSRSLTLADAAKGFPVGSDSAPVILKWRKVGDENDLPITVNFWPNAEGKHTSVNVEFTVNQDVLGNAVASSNKDSNNETATSTASLHDLMIRINVGGDAPEVGQVDGEWKYDSRARQLVWRLATVGGASGLESGSLEFKSTQKDIDAFYPISIDFVGQDSLLSGLSVAGVRPTEGTRTVPFTAVHRVEVEKFIIE